ncbi:hypothetical protein P7H25_02715 [Paenibacillus larvae]|nr:hypothetical protein [Paenibacillus larvae]MDT2254766.1 hypothetical protein [Paenibacillus larvae]
MAVAGSKEKTEERLSLEDKLLNYQREQEKELGLDQENKNQWFDPVPRQVLAKEKPNTTLLFGGLTMAHDYLVEGALKGLGYRVKHLDCPDNESLRLGKEFGNRGQCNPTYFTVGNLIKNLQYLRDVEGNQKKRSSKTTCSLRAVPAARAASGLMSRNTERLCAMRVLTGFGFFCFNKRTA